MNTEKKIDKENPVAIARLAFACNMQALYIGKYSMLLVG